MSTQSRYRIIAKGASQSPTNRLRLVFLVAVFALASCQRGVRAESDSASTATPTASGGAPQGGTASIGAGTTAAGAGPETKHHTGPTPYTLFMNDAVGAIKMGAVAVDKTHVYWGENGGNLVRRPIDASTKAERIGQWYTTLLGLQLALDQDYVYWLDMSDWMRAPKSGGTAERIVLEAKGGDVAANESHAYAALLGCASIVRAAHGTLATEAIYPPAPVQVSPGGTYLHLDGTDAYCAAGRYVFVSHAWGPMEELTSSMNQVTGVAIVDGEPYWLDIAADRSHSSLYRRSKDGQVVFVGTTDFSSPNRPEADPARRRILFTTAGAVVSMSVETGSWKLLTLSTFPGSGSARDDNYFYWGRATSVDASIERMPLTYE